MALLLLLLASAQYTAAVPSDAFATCSERFEVDDDTYVPASYEPTWGVKTAAAFTSNPLPLNITFGAELISDPYFMEVLTASATMAAFIIMITISFCCYMCCRKKCCPCCKCKGPFEKPIPLKILLVFWFSLVILASLSGLSGRTEFNKTPDSFHKAGGVVIASFDTLSATMLTGQNAADAMATTAGDLVDGACDFASDGADPVEVAAVLLINDGIKDAATELEDALSASSDTVGELRTEIDASADDITTQINDGTKLVDDYMVAYVEPATLGLCLVFVGIAALGVIGTFLGKGGRKCLFGSMICIAWPIIMLMVLFMTIEMLLSLVVSDVCTPSPLGNVMSLIGDDDTLSFYVTCDGTNPLAEQLLSQDVAFNAIYESLCNVSQAIGDNSRNYSGATEEKTIYKADSAACNAALQSLNGETVTLGTSAESLFRQAGSCGMVNKPLGILLNEGVCDSLAGGMYSMYAAQISSVVFMLFGMYIVLPAWSQLDGDNKVTPDNAKGGAKKGSKTSKRSKKKKGAAKIEIKKKKDPAPVVGAHGDECKATEVVSPV